jgi:hypothetical protein
MRHPQTTRDSHRGLYVVRDDEAARLRDDAIQAQMSLGYGEQTARQTVDKISGFPAQRAGA